MTKKEVRERARRRLVTGGAAHFPSEPTSVPNFSGAAEAAQRLRELDVWQRAATVKSDSSAPLHAVRRAAIEDGKRLYLAMPGLSHERCFLEVDPGRVGRIRRAASLRGAAMFGRMLAPHELPEIDLFIAGSLAVSREGARVGRGDGHVDLEYALLRSAERITDATPVITLVHPLQIVRARIPMRAHDVPADLVITPEAVFVAPALYRRPAGVIWNLIAPERIEQIRALRPWVRKRGTPSGVSS